MTKKEITRLKKNLPKGYAADMAINFNVSERFVQMVASGDRENDDILVLLIDLASKEKIRKSNLRKRLKKLAA